MSDISCWLSCFFCHLAVGPLKLYTYEVCRWFCLTDCWQKPLNKLNYQSVPTAELFVCFGCSVQTDQLTIIHTRSSESLRLIEALSQQLMSSYFVRNEDKRVKYVKNIYLCARRSKKVPRLPSQALSLRLSPIVGPRWLTPAVASH